MMKKTHGKQKKSKIKKAKKSNNKNYLGQTGPNSLQHSRFNGWPSERGRASAKKYKYTTVSFITTPN